MAVNKVILSDDPLIRHEYLYDCYISKKMSSEQISNILGVSSANVRRMLRRSNIPLRSRSEAQKLCTNRPETKKKMSLSATGRKLSEAAKEKLRKRIGSLNHNYRNGITITTQGYISFTASKSNGEHSQKCLHVILAEWKYGRKIKKGEHVHHIDGNKMNNSPDNLVIVSASDHAHIHTEDRENGKFKSM